MFGIHQGAGGINARISKAVSTIGKFRSSWLAKLPDLGTKEFGKMNCVYYGKSLP